MEHTSITPATSAYRADIQAALQPQHFLHLPFQQQIDLLKISLPTIDPFVLLELCAISRDHEPLIFALQWLFSQNWPTNAQEQIRLADFLLEQPDSAGLQVSLLLDRLLADDSAISTTQRERIAALLLQCAERAPIQRLQLFCLLDRPLLRYFPQQHQALLDQLQNHCQHLLNQEHTEAIPEVTLLKLPASRLAALKLPSEQKSRFQDLLKRAAHAAIEILAAVPKPISQARAEELLSRRVYDDPGHFLFELLQNAEDQQARRWCLHFGPSEILVWHDGLPFDARDLVGVTSIGQSNKKRHQIGFFGVGFKSVYEITRRPQIYSDAYQFEIADVSMPRALEKRPAVVPPSMQAHGTLLVLPLREQDHEARSPHRLYLRTHGLDPVILLTLRHIVHIEATLDPSLHAQLPPHTAPTQQITLQGDRQSTHVTIQRHDPHTHQHYLLASAEISVATGLRSADRASHTRLLLGMACDPRGIPQPLPPQAPRLYSFLPTAEDPGLDFFLQAHFDVPVDRERILRDSPWNHYLLQQVPPLFLQIAKELFSRSQQDHDPAPLRGFLRLLPLQERLHDPLWKPLVDALPDILSNQPLFPDTTDTIRSPQDLYIAPPSVALLLDTIPLPNTIFKASDSIPSERWPAKLDLQPEEALRLQQLGVPTFALPMWLDLLASWLHDHPEGTPPPEKLSSLFASPRIDRLYQQLTHLLQSQTAEDPSRCQASLQQLRELPLLLGQDGGLYRPSQGQIALGIPAIRQAWGSQQRFLPQHLQDQASDLFQRLGIPTRSFRDLANKLSQALTTHNLSSDPHRHTQDDLLPHRTKDDNHRTKDDNHHTQENTHHPHTPKDIPRSNAQSHIPLLRLTLQDYTQRWPVPHAILLDSLKHATENERKAFARLPLFLAHDQHLYPLAQDPQNNGAFFLPPSPAYKAAFALLSPLFPLLSEDISIRQHFPTLSLDPAALVALITHHADRFHDRLLDLHAVLGQIADDLTHTQLHALCKAPLWLTTQQRITSIDAPDAPMLTHDPDLPHFLPSREFIHPAIAAQPHTRLLPVSSYGITDLFEAMLATDPPLEVFQSYLLERASHLRTLPFEQRAKAPLFLDQHDTRQSAQALSRSPAPAWIPFLQRRGERRYLAAHPPEQSALLQALDLESVLRSVAPAEILRESFQQIHTLDAQEKQQLLGLILQHIDALPFGLLDMTRKSPIFPDTSGDFAPLADWDKTPWHEHIPKHLIFRCEPPLLRAIFEQAGFRLLSTDTQNAIHPLFQPLSIRDASLGDLLALLRHTPLSSEKLQAPILRLIRRFLQQHLDDLRTLFPPNSRPHRADGHPDLEALPLFSNQLQQPTPLSQLTDSPLLDDLWGHESAWQRRRLHPDEQADLAAFSGLMAPSSVFEILRDTLLETALPLRPLTEQPAPLASIEHLQQHLQRLSPLCSATELSEMPLWADRKSRLRKGPLSRQGTHHATWLESLSITNELLHPALESALTNDLRDAFPEVSVFHLLDAFSSGSFPDQPVAKHPILGALERRKLFYDFLLQRWEALCTDERSAKRLRTSALFTATDAKLHTLYEIDWSTPAHDPQRPHPETLIPSELSQRIERHLLEHPLSVPEQARSLFARLLESATQDDLASFQHTYTALAHLWQHAPSSQQKQMLLSLPQEELLFPTLTAQWLPLSRILLPDSEDRDALAQLLGPSLQFHLPQHPAAAAFAHAIGIAKEPDSKTLRQQLDHLASTEDYKAFARYLSRHPQCLPIEALRSTPWMLDDQQAARHPSDLYWFDDRIQRLTLNALGIFPAPFYEDLLPTALHKPLRFRSIKDLGLLDVLPARPDHSTLDQDVLLWIEHGLEDRRFARDLLQTHTSRLTLPCHDGQPRPPRLVLAFPPSPLFADLRGFWPEGAHRYPLFCKALNIPTQISPDLVRNFLENIGQSARQDTQLLHKHPSLLDALPRCYAYLHPQQSTLHTKLPVFLAERIDPQRTPPTNKAQIQRDPSHFALLSSDAKGFFVCQRPTLIAPYRSLSFSLAALGPADIAPDAAAFVLACGVPAFESCISIKISTKAGKDTTQRHTEALDRLREQIQALRSVLPRVQAQRGGSDADWTFADQLAALLQPNAIHVFQGLHVKASLKDVGKLDIPEMITYDPQKHRLMLDEKLLRSLSDATPRLAFTLAPLVHRDPQQQALPDMLELLLRCQTLPAMQQYLDQRHFPRAILAQKHHKKKPNDTSYTHSDLDDAHSEYTDTYDISDAFDPSRPDQAPAPQPATQGFFRDLWSRFFRKPPTTPTRPTNTDTSDQNNGSIDQSNGNIDKEHSNIDQSADTSNKHNGNNIDQSADTSDKNNAPPKKPTPPPKQERPASSSSSSDDAPDRDDAPPFRFLDAFNRLLERPPRPSKQRDPNEAFPRHDTHDPTPPFPYEDSAHNNTAPSDPNDWNRPRDFIGPQLDFDAYRFGQHAPNPQDIGLFHQPTALPHPYRYALHTVTGYFDPRTQRWSPTPLKAPLIWQHGPKIGSILFQGNLPPGLIQLPMPLHSASNAPPELTCNGATVDYRVKAATPDTWQIQINAPSIATIRYTLDLYSPAPIASQGSIHPNKHYLQPTTRREDLPPALQDFLSDLQSSDLSALEKARRIEQLVRKRYLYEMQYAKRPAVRAARERIHQDRRPLQNDALILLHAGQHGAYWGVGVCHGLNLLIAEMLRQVGIPSAIATCWVLDQGFLSRPDHLIALALLPTDGGLTALPLDGAVNHQDRVLHSASPPPPKKVPDLPRLPPPNTQSAALIEQIALYQQLLAHLQTPPPLPSLEELDFNALQRQFQAVRQHLLDALGSKHLLHRLLAILDAGELRTEHLDPTLQTLLDRGLIQAEQHTTWQIRPRDRD